MKTSLSLLALMLPLAAFGERPIQFKVDWLNHEERGCKGCGSQVVINHAGAPFYFGEECTTGMVWLKIVTQWKGGDIELSLTRQSHKGDTFADEGPTRSVVVGEDDVKEIAVGEFRFALSGHAAPDETSNQPAPPTPQR